MMRQVSVRSTLKHGKYRILRGAYPLLKHDETVVVIMPDELEFSIKAYAVDNITEWLGIWKRHINLLRSDVTDCLIFDTFVVHASNAIPAKREDFDAIQYVHLLSGITAGQQYLQAWEQYYENVDFDDGRLKTCVIGLLCNGYFQATGEIEYGSAGQWDLLNLLEQRFVDEPIPTLLIAAGLTRTEVDAEHDNLIKNWI